MLKTGVERVTSLRQEVCALRREENPRRGMSVSDAVRGAEAFHGLRRKNDVPQGWARPFAQSVLFPNTGVVEPEEDAA